MDLHSFSPLEWLAWKAGVSCLSDLRFGLRSAETTAALREALRHCPSENWTVQDWAEAAGYLTGEERLTQTAAEAAALLLAALS